MQREKSILMVMMEPSVADEEEFHHWYDAEHLPERARLPGFLSAQRFVCLAGWPRYMALYDLAHPGVLQEPPYLAVGGANFSPWSKRVIGAVRGWLRVEGVQVPPTDTVTGANGAAVRVVVIRIRGVADGDEAGVQAALGIMLRDRSDVLQWRLFRSTRAPAGEFCAIFELGSPASLESLDWQALRLPSGHVDVANCYSRYWHSEP
ncbi:MAG: hypothetical protein M0Z28_33090 [Rhodospirillales bacterium]|nr:hypothetical protein [Rhodospirillales bacterium]